MNDKNSTEAFHKRLAQSRHSVFVAAEYLHKAGYNIYIPAFDFRPLNSDWQDHVDNGDMYIWKDKAEKHRIDVKHSSADFTSRDDYPYPNMFVSDIRAVERAKPFPLAYLIVNKACTHMGVVWGKTKDQWKPKTYFARNTDMMVTTMSCSLSIVDFRSLYD